MPRAIPLKRYPSTNASQGLFLVLDGGKGFITWAICSSIAILLLGSFSHLRSLRPFCPLLDTCEHPAHHHEVLPLYEQVVQKHISHMRLEAASLPQEQACSSLVDLFQDEGPGAPLL